MEEVLALHLLAVHPDTRFLPHHFPFLLVGSSFIRHTMVPLFTYILLATLNI